MGIDYLILILLLKVRHSLFGMLEFSKSEEYVIKDYDGIVCDAPKEVPQKRTPTKLHLVK
jgi:hypothetical protein